MTLATATRRTALSLIGATLAAPAFVGRARAAEVTLKLHHFLPPQAPAQKGVFEPWAADLAAASDGRIEIQMFPAMQLGGKAPQLADQVKSGITDIAWTLPVYTPGRYPLAETFNLPFMATNAEKTSIALQTFMDEVGGAEFEGIHPLSFHTHAAGKLHMREKPISTMADLADQRVRAPGQGVGDFLAALGAEPVFFPVTEMTVGLANGVIDGACLPYEVVPAYKLQELTSFHSEAAPGGRGIYANAFAFLMNQAAYEGMPDDLRAVLDAHSGMVLAERFGKAFDAAEATGRQACLDAGNTINEIAASEIELWREKAVPIQEAWVGTLNDAGYDGTALLARANALIDAGES
jgi:TRAP-type C4-dicarboxylate transport system substrate-binding protein